MTIKDIINILPLTSQVRDDLLNGWDSFSEDARYELTWVLYDAYYAYQEQQEQKKLLVALSDDTIPKDENFYATVGNEIAHELKTQNLNTSQSNRLAALRTQIEAIQKSPKKTPVPKVH